VSLHNTIHSRQRDQTHTNEIALNDIWHLTPSSELQLSSFFRTYSLSLYSDFGDGLIRQSEFRTVTGGNATDVRKINQYLSIMLALPGEGEPFERVVGVYLPPTPPYRSFTASDTLGAHNPCTRRV